MGGLAELATDDDRAVRATGPLALTIGGTRSLGRQIESRQVTALEHSPQAITNCCCFTAQAGVSFSLVRQLLLVECSHEIRAARVAGLLWTAGSWNATPAPHVPAKETKQDARLNSGSVPLLANLEHPVLAAPRQAPATEAGVSGAVSRVVKSPRGCVGRLSGSPPISTAPMLPSARSLSSFRHRRFAQLLRRLRGRSTPSSVRTARPAGSGSSVAVTFSGRGGSCT
jgi:hypothetical protein